jgi:hypothetical protein
MHDGNENCIAYTILIGKPEGKIQLGKHQPKIKPYLRELWCENVNWIQMAQDIAGFRKHCNKIAVSTKHEFLDQLSNYELFMKHPAPWNCSFICFFVSWLGS